MRLIDADELKSECTQHCGRRKPLETKTRDCERPCLIVRLIDEAPTIYPTIHAQWEVCEDESGTYGICSNCGCDTPFWTGEPVEHCCRCGAKMDLKDGDNNATN